MFSTARLKNGWSILAAFAILRLRLIGPRLWENVFGKFDYQASLTFILFPFALATVSCNIVVLRLYV